MPGEGLNDVGEGYSTGMALVYVFNLIVGTGALAMPKAIKQAGWLIGLLMVIFIAFMSLVTATMTIEALACANALSKWSEKQKRDKSKSIANGPNGPNLSELDTIEVPDDTTVSPTNNDKQHLITETSQTKESGGGDYYEIKERIEFGQMASMFFHKSGVVAFYLVIVVYLYGDLAIYGAAVPKSVRDVICNFNPNNQTLNITNATLEETGPCFKGQPNGMTRFGMYQIMLTVFFILMLPFAFFNVQKTKWLQIGTSVLRWVSFLTMICIAISRIAKGKIAHPSVANTAGIPNLFGACIYSFMCHHSLPSLISPVRNKDKVTALFVADYSLILGFYTLVSMTAVYAFEDLQDLYTLNFSPNTVSDVDIPTGWIWIKYFIALFPAFTISANFPIIAITLRNNLKTLIQSKIPPTHEYVDRLLYPLLAIVPPIIIVYFTNDVSVLVGITGAYAGAGIQYLLPAFLVWQARKQLDAIFGSLRNKHASPFKGSVWVWLTVAWCFLALIFVTWDLIEAHT